jgi:hypothetical protein
LFLDLPYKGKTSRPLRLLRAAAGAALRSGRYSGQKPEPCRLQRTFETTRRGSGQAPASLPKRLPFEKIGAGEFSALLALLG